MASIGAVRDLDIDVCFNRFWLFDAGDGGSLFVRSLITKVVH